MMPLDARQLTIIIDAAIPAAFKHAIIARHYRTEESLRALSQEYGLPVCMVQGWYRLHQMQRRMAAYGVDYQNPAGGHNEE